MAESNKDIHIVFQVLNFIFGWQSDDYTLLPFHRLLLIALARHKGIKGIYPSIATLAKELKVSSRYVKTSLLHLESLKLIAIDRDNGRSSRYYLDFLQPTEHLQITGDPQFTGELQITPPSICRSPHRASVDHPINTEEELKRNNRERARKKRAALTDSFLPSEKINNLWIETASKSGKSKEELLSKFKNLQKSKQGTSADWNAEFENFLINERPMGFVTKQNGNGNGNGQTKATEKFFDDPTHPNYETFKLIREMKTNQPKEEPVVQEPSEHLSFREIKRRHELRLQHGELNDGNLSNHNGRGKGS